jgi:hypothetical protein
MPMIGDEMMHKFCVAVATQKKENIKNDVRR